MVRQSYLVVERRIFNRKDVVRIPYAGDYIRIGNLFELMDSINFKTAQKPILLTIAKYVLLCRDLKTRYFGPKRLPVFMDSTKKNMQHWLANIYSRAEQKGKEPFSSMTSKEENALRKTLPVIYGRLKSYMLART